MVQPNEYRINNYVRILGHDESRFKSCVKLLSTGNNWLDVAYKTVSDVEGITQMPFDKIAPIYLSDNILRLIGRERKADTFIIGKYWLEKMHGYYQLADEEYSYVFAPKLKYLHELQNLYFALTGEEFNIEL